MVLGSASCVIYGSASHLNDFSRENNWRSGASDGSKFYWNVVN